MNRFKDDYQIQIMLSRHLKGKAPPEWEPKDWKKFYRTFIPTNLTPYHFAAMIWQGYSFTPIYSNGRRKEENFCAAYHIAFDFDEDGAALDFLMREGSTAWLFSSFAYSTPSSTADHPKSRVVFVFDEPITDSNLFRELYQALAWRFESEGSKTDPSCKDPLRLYFGSLGCEVSPNWSVLTTVSNDPLRPSMLGFFINEYQIANPPPPPPPKNPSIVKTPASDSYIESRINKLLDNVINAPNGEKHNTLNRNAFVLGGLVAGGYLSRFDAVSKLENAIRTNGQAKDLNAAKTTIETAVSDGMAKPITIEQTYKRDMDEIL